MSGRVWKAVHVLLRLLLRRRDIPRVARQQLREMANRRAVRVSNYHYYSKTSKVVY